MRDEESLVLGDLCTEWTPAEFWFDGVTPSAPYEFSVQFDIIGVVGGSACN
ncbi:hypothetical protein [Enhygromyxa salina]|nr:hypothetical protein [Enhygromyxa salina]